MRWATPVVPEAASQRSASALRAARAASPSPATNTSKGLS
jgi:hypothetical protein